MKDIDALLAAAASAAQDESASPTERAEMLMELAAGLQRRPESVAQLAASIRLCDDALALSRDALQVARIRSRRAGALRALPSQDAAPVEEARAAYEQAIPVLAKQGLPAEVAEAEMNLGLCLHFLAGLGRARITDAVAAYQRALRTFDAARYPVEFALLQSNLATAFLSIRDEKAALREAIAVQCFEQGLKAVNLVDHPVEYAMLQNNLGNALQTVASGHAAANHVRALAAYDEALKVRSRAARPVEYANTVANKANCLWTLGRIEEATQCYRDAREVFLQHGEMEKARAVAECLGEA